MAGAYHGRRPRRAFIARERSAKCPYLVEIMTSSVRPSGDIAHGIAAGIELHEMHRVHRAFMFLASRCISVDPMYRSRVVPRLSPTPLERKLLGVLKRGRVTLSLRQATLQFQRAMVRVVLARHKREGGYNMSAVARDLGVPRNSLYALLEKM
jgi:hypothetical protein